MSQAFSAPVFAFDLGGVTTLRVYPDQPFPKRFVDGAVENIAGLVELFGRNRAFIVSRVPEIREGLTLQWLFDQRFFKQTGMYYDHVRFVREREEKAGVYRDLGATHLVDNRTEVFAGVPASCRKYLFCPPGSMYAESELKKFQAGIDNAQLLQDWHTGAARIAEDFRRDMRQSN